MTSSADTRLATYGTLAPGRPNHGQLADLDGRWLTGRVRGRLVESGWGAELGFPALVLDPDGPPIEVQVFDSRDLPRHWERLDEFEGSGYGRVVVEIETDEGVLAAWIYVATDSLPTGTEHHLGAQTAPKQMHSTGI